LLAIVKAWDYADNSKTYQAAYTIGLTPTPTYTLRFESAPVAGVVFKLDGRGQTTPYSSTPGKGEHTVTVPAEVTIAGETFKLVRWEDGSTDSTRTLDLRANTILNTSYEAAP